MPNPDQPAPELGPYYDEQFRFLGAVTAICCGPDSERIRFWQDAGDPLKFCTERYRLRDEHTKILWAPLDNPPDPRDNRCHPNHDQAKAVVDALVKELEANRPHSPKRELPLAFNPDLAVKFKTLAALFTAFALGDGEAPADWRDELVKEVMTADESGPDIW